MSKSTADYYKTLGLPVTASPEEIRNAYLALVRLHPPDADADKFREIYTAYQTLSEPMVQAIQLLKLPDAPDLQAIVAEAEKAICRLPKLALLALGDSA